MSFRKKHDEEFDGKLIQDLINYRNLKRTFTALNDVEIVYTNGQQRQPLAQFFSPSTNLFVYISITLSLVYGA